MATVSIPNQLEEALRVRAANEHRTVDELVGEALDWYLRIDPELLDELAGWQQVRDEALDLVEGSTE